MMKKRTLLLSFPLVGLLPAFTNAEQCNQEFYDTLRYGREYDFADNYHANSSDKWVWNKEIMIKEEYDYNQSDYVPKFKRTQAIKDANRKIAKDTSMEIIATDPTQPGYKISAVPEKRSYDNLLVKYTIESSTNAAGNDRYNHTECAYYAITWCGDEIVDVAQEGDKWESEECDYNDPEKKGWEDGSGKTCNKSCKIESIQASCGALDINSPKYNENHPDPRITESSEGLCEVGNLEAGSFVYDSKTGKYTWNCINGNSNAVNCAAQDKWCGDGEIMTTKEECDPEHPDYKGKGTCSNNCKLEDPLCSSEYNNKKAYQKPEFLYLKGTELLCNPGIIQDFWKGGVPLRFTWSCKNSTKEPDTCVFNQYRCGDGQVNGGGDWSKNGWIDGKEHYEACDPEASEWKDRTDGQKCNSECGFDTAICGSKANTTEYNVNFPTERITISDVGLCGLGKLVEGSFKLDKITGKYTWQCKNGTKENSCEAQDLWCGDGVRNGTEVCDPKDSTKENWGDGCSATCEKVYGDAVCGSKYNGQTKYQDIRDEWLNKNTNGLCDKGNVINFSLNKTTGKYTWQCENGTKVSDACTAKQEWCGDGKRQEKEEVCDPKDSTKENWGDGCSATCEKTYQDAICGSEYNGKTKYQDISNERLNKNTKGLCDKGNVINFSLNKTTGKYTWQCKNDTKESEPCNAQQLWCGNGEVEEVYGEECDGGDDCNAQCKKVKPSDECDASFYYKLRHGQQYRFYDEFHAKDTDKRLKKWTMTYKEQYDYNESPDFPVFDWTKEILATSGKVVANTSMRILEAKTTYPILAIPAKRAYDNLFIRYDLVYSTDAAGSNKYSHAECAYYEISRCGDGILDIAQEGDKWESEQCDPGSEGTKVLPDGRICNSDCTIGSTPKTGTLKIEKTLKNKKEVTKTGEILTWDVRVRAEGGDVTNFKIEDLLPIALEYQTGKVIKNDDNLTLTGPILSETIKTGDVKWDNYTGNVYIWDVNGTLQNGHELILQITTKVVKMPKSQDDYRNVACVIKNNTTIECDDDQPGTRRVEKTLVGSKEVKTTGDLVTWNLKLIVDKGEVKNPVIRDILPPVLGYKSGSYTVINNPGITISKPTTGAITSGSQTLEQIVWNTEGTVKAGEYVEIQLTTYVKVMPDKEYKNVLCVKPDGEEEKCDPEPIGPNLRIKKYHLNVDGTTTKDEKIVKIGDEISYKIMFGNDGTSPATITSIKDFLPKNIQYVTGTIVINRNPDYKTTDKVVDSQHQSGTGGETIDILRGEKPVNGFKVVDGVHIEIYGGITLNPGDTGYIILTGKVLGTNLDNRVNYACIYLNDKKIDCDDVTHRIDSLICSKEDFKITTTSFSYNGGSTDVSCGTSPKGEIADIIVIDCGTGSTGIRYYTGEKVSSLTGSCKYPQNNTTDPVTYTVQCKVNNVDSNDCTGNVTVDKYTCFPAGTKIVMADGSSKNIENVEKGDTVLSYNTDKNVNEVSVVNKTIIHENSENEMYELTINGETLRATDLHPFYVRESIFSKNYNWIEAKNLKVGNILLMSDGKLAEIEKINHYKNEETVYNLEVEGNHNYFVDKGYLVHNKGVGSSPSCKSITTDPVDLYNGANVEVTCNTQNGSAYVLIDCNYTSTNKYDETNKDKTYFVSDGRVSTFTKTCKNYQLDTKIQCLVKDSSSTKWENASVVTACGKSKDKGGSSSTSSPGNPPKPDKIYDSTNCFNVNAGNASIEQGEILPFYRNIEKLSKAISGGVFSGTSSTGASSGTVYVSGLFIEYKLGNYPYGKESNYSKIKSESCSGQDGAIALNSMICSFRIIDGTETEVRSGTSPCLSEKSKKVEPALLSGWADWSIKKYAVGPKSFRSLDTYKDKSYSFRSNVNYIKNFGDGLKIFGEYKISLTKIAYLQCQDGSWVDGKQLPDECQSNFVLTNPYTVQKTPSGNLKASTQQLDNYLYMDGKKVKMVSELLKAVAVSEYSPNETVNNAMDEFIKKYQRLAVSIKKDGEAIKKVPGKDIYFIEKDYTITDKKFTKPFTFVQTDPTKTITIKGSIENLNMMILTKGKIIFEDTNNCNPKSQQTRQVVKGIFYSSLANNGIERANVKKNNTKDKYQRCTEGGLTIKGVLIGNGLKNMMENSRSNLNNWFETSDKKGTVMNGASVLIEYSPSVFTKSTMPPGAEDFTTALSIYKN